MIEPHKILPMPPRSNPQADFRPIRAIAIVVMLVMSGCQSIGAPKSEQPPAAKHLAVSIDRAGKISFDGEVVTVEQLDARLRSLDPNVNVILSADADADFSAVAKAMAAVQRSGHQKMGVIGGT